MCQFRILGEAPIILTRLYRVLHKSVQENTEKTAVPQIMPRPLPSTSLPMHYSHHSALHSLLCSTVFPKDLTVAQLHHKFLAFYGNQWFITGLKTNRHPSPSCGTSVQYTFCPPGYLKSTLTFRLLMLYIYGAPILDVSRSHTTTHSQSVGLLWTSDQLVAETST